MRGASLYTYLLEKKRLHSKVFGQEEKFTVGKQQFREATNCLPKLLKIDFKE